MENSRAAEKIGDKVLAIICNHSSRYPTDSQYLVQYNDDENWCFPGGCIRLAESSGQAVYREIQEQYGLELEHFWRPILHQNKSLEKQSTRNPVTFFQVCRMKFSATVNSEFDMIGMFQHKKKKLLWCSCKDLEKSVYSKEILDSVFHAMYKEEETDWNMTFDEADCFLKANPYILI